MESMNLMNQPSNAVCDQVREALMNLRMNGARVQENGLWQYRRVTFADVAVATGISRSAISMLANKGLAPSDDSMQRVIEFIRQYEPDFLANSDADKEANAEHSSGDLNELTALAMDDASEPPAESREYKNAVELFRTREFNQAMGWCDYIHAKRRMGVMIGYPGSGKTTILREFCKLKPTAHYIECWPMMRVGDLLGQLAGAAGVPLSGNNYAKTQQILQALSQRADITLVFDEAEYLRTWDVTKFEVLRKLWDNTHTPVIIAGTPELESMLTRGSGRENLAQLYRRKYEIKLNGIQPGEVKQILAEYNITPDASAELCKVATDARHGGMGNFVEILDMCLETANGSQITAAIVNGAKQYKLMY